MSSRYDPDACIGCRYCVFGCPFGVPQFDFNDPFGKIAKCQFCSHLQKDGKLPACCDVCPTGASLFGTVKDLEQEIYRRHLLRPSARPINFPAAGSATIDRRTTATIPTYVKAVYGEHEAGGTQVRYLAGIPFPKLGLPTVSAQSPASLAEGVQHTIYQWLIAPLIAFAGLAFLARRNSPPVDADGAPNSRRS